MDTLSTFLSPSSNVCTYLLSADFADWSLSFAKWWWRKSVYMKQVRKSNKPHAVKCIFCSSSPYLLAVKTIESLRITFLCAIHGRAAYLRLTWLQTTLGHLFKTCRAGQELSNKLFHVENGRTVGE